MTIEDMGEGEDQSNYDTDGLQEDNFGTYRHD